MRVFRLVEKKAYSNYLCDLCGQDIIRGRHYRKVYTDLPKPVLRVCFNCELPSIIDKKDRNVR